MRIIIAPDSFKGSAGSIEVAQAIREGFSRIYPDADYQLIPIADGGEGTTEAILLASGGTQRTAWVQDPLGRTIQAHYGLLPDDRAVLEMAEASGLPLLKESERDPKRTSTYGTGQLIRAALDEGARDILIGIGGSATNDCGMGMAQALGVRFLDAEDRELGSEPTELLRLEHIDISGLDRRISECRITVACDVTNPLTGPRGASAVYGPQKGATDADVQLLDDALSHCSDVILRDLGLSIDEVPGSGAAGGLGAGLMAFLGAELKAGIDAVLQLVRFDQIVADADLVITGEGRLDYQTVYGKVPAGIASWTKRSGDIPVVAIVGDIGKDFQKVYEVGIDVVLSTVNKAMSLQEAMGDSTRLLIEAGERAARFVDIGRRLSHL